MGYTTLEVGWESIYLIKTSQTVIQEFAGYQMGFNGLNGKYSLLFAEMKARRKL